MGERLRHLAGQRDDGAVLASSAGALRRTASGHRRGALRRTTAADHRDAVEFQAGRGDRPVRIRPDPPPGRHRHPHLRTERPGTRLRLRRRGNPLPLRTRYAARASAVVQRRCRQRSEPAPVPQRGIHRDRRQTRLAMAAQRLSRRGDAAKDNKVSPLNLYSNKQEDHHRKSYLYHHRYTLPHPAPRTLHNDHAPNNHHRQTAVPL